MVEEEGEKLKEEERVKTTRKPKLEKNLEVIMEKFKLVQMLSKNLKTSSRSEAHINDNLKKSLLELLWNLLGFFGFKFVKNNLYYYSFNRIIEFPSIISNFIIRLEIFK